MSTSGTKAATLGADNPFRYRGYYYDNETGLYYLNARYYNPKTGRFLTQDAMGGDQWTNNLYTYCGNNPIGFKDPTGYRLEEGSGVNDRSTVTTASNNSNGHDSDDVWAEYTRRMRKAIDAIWARELKLDLKTKEGRAKLITFYLRADGWAEDAISAVLGNFDSETDWTLDPGKESDSADSGYGLAQWTGVEKDGNRTKLENYLDEKGYPHNSIRGQLDFLWQSMQGNNGQWFRDKRNNKAHYDYYLSPEHFKSGEASYADNYDKHFGGMTNVQALTQIFYWSYERSSSGWNTNRYWGGI